MVKNTTKHGYLPFNPLDIFVMPLVAILTALGFIGRVNHNEIAIMNLLVKESMSVRDISKTLKLDYKNAWRYCRKLYDKGLVNLIPPPNESSKGNKVIVSLKEDIKEKVIKENKSNQNERG